MMMNYSHLQKLTASPARLFFRYAPTQGFCTHTINKTGFVKNIWNNYFVNHRLPRYLMYSSPFVLYYWVYFGSSGYREAHRQNTKAKQLKGASKIGQSHSKIKGGINNEEKFQNFIDRSKKTLFQQIVHAFIHIARFFQLMLIFSPPILLYPLILFDFTRSFWMDLFVKSVERAGVVWIKSFQYLSHRRDIIGIQMAQKFIHLREHAPQHTFQETKKDFKATYGKQIHDIFQQFDQEPIASGSVSQVYKAKYHGKKVAVKVRHPDVQKYISRDINLLFFFSRFLSIFSKSFSIPVTQISMKRTLNQQINFLTQQQNLIIFYQQFKDRQDITFPQPFQKDSTDSFLIETFVEGVPITYFQKQENDHVLKPVIARLGAETFFDMLLKHNFIHADAHGGNLMVQFQEKSLTFFGQIWQYIKENLLLFEDKIIQGTIQSQLLRKLYKQGSEESAYIRKIMRQARQKVILTIIDTGMVITLDESDRHNFILYLKNIIHGDGEQCAQMIYNLSTYNNTKIKPNQFPIYYSQLQQLFTVINKKDLQNLPGLELFKQLLSIIRQNDIKLQGQFATLLTNMLVLQGLAKDISPDINILKIALPYFNNLDKDKQVKQTQPNRIYDI